MGFHSLGIRKRKRLLIDIEHSPQGSALSGEKKQVPESLTPCGYVKPFDKQIKRRHNGAKIAVVRQGGTGQNTFHGGVACVIVKYACCGGLIERAALRLLHQDCIEALGEEIGRAS